MKKKSTIALFGIMAIMQIAPLQMIAAQQIKKDNFTALCKINGSQKESFQLGLSIDPEETYQIGLLIGKALKEAKDTHNDQQIIELINLIELGRLLYLSRNLQIAQRNDVIGDMQRLYNERDYNAFLRGVIVGAMGAYEMEYSLVWKLINPPKGGSDDGKGPLWNIVQGV